MTDFAENAIDTFHEINIMHNLHFLAEIYVESQITHYAGHHALHILPNVIPMSKAKWRVIIGEDLYCSFMVIFDHQKTISQLPI